MLTVFRVQPLAAPSVDASAREGVSKLTEKARKSNLRRVPSARSINRSIDDRSIDAVLRAAESQDPPHDAQTQLTCPNPNP